MEKLYIKFKPYVILAFIVLISTFVLWLPFLLKSNSWFGLKIKNPGFQTIVQNFDGPLYVVPAKTLYDVDKISPPGEGLIVSLPITKEYFAAHLPIYPIFIRLFSPFFGYLKSMLVVNVVFTILLSWFFYYLLSKFKIKNPLILSTIFLFLPRFLVVRSVGAPESMFILFILMSIYFFDKQKYLLSGIFGGLSVMTKTPGIILFGAYFIILLINYIKTKKFNLNYLWLILIPFSLFSVFLFYFFKYGDFFVYLHTGGLVPMPYPFSVFNFQKEWVGTAWLDDLIFYFTMYGLTVYYLYKTKFKTMFYFALLFFISLLFVQHRDIARYSLPLWPFSIIVFNKFFSSKAFLIVFFAIILPASIFYSWNFLLYNIMPIGDWAPFL